MPRKPIRPSNLSDELALRVRVEVNALVDKGKTKTRAYEIIAEAVEVDWQTIRNFDEGKLINPAAQAQLVKRYYFDDLPLCRKYLIQLRDGENTTANLKDVVEGILEELDIHHLQLPIGSYPIDETFIEKVKRYGAKHRITPEDFYTFQPDTAWYGVLNGWDAERSFYRDLKTKALENIGDRRQYVPAVSVSGPGGSGKSIVLRRLAVDLAKRHHFVYWVDEPEELEKVDLSELTDGNLGPIFLFLDEVQHFESGRAKRFIKKLNKRKRFFLIACGREMPSAFQSSRYKFKTSDADDIPGILRTISKKSLRFETIASKLAEESLRKARLIRMLVVMDRYRDKPGKIEIRNTEELETKFLEILADDLEWIERKLPEFPGIVHALIDVAAMAEMGAYTSIETFLGLVERYQQHIHSPKKISPASGALQPFDDNERWTVLSRLISINKKYQAICFLHNELAEGIIRAVKIGILEKCGVVDRHWYLRLLNTVVEVGSNYTSSYLLSALFEKNYIGTEDALSCIESFIEKGNGHHAHLGLILNDTFNIPHQNRLDLISKASIVAFDNTHFGSRLWMWVIRQNLGKEETARMLTDLYNSGYTSAPVVVGLLNHSDPNQAKKYAKHLVMKSHDHQVICRCFDFLNPADAKEAAERLIEKSHDHQVICRCFYFLDEKTAREKAKELIEEPNQHPFIICRCLDFLDEKTAREKAKELIEKPNQSPFIICCCLEYLDPIDAQKAAEGLTDDRNQLPDIICRCLKYLDPIDAEKTAEELIDDPNQSPEIICQCFDYLDDETAREKAKELIEKSHHHQVICRCLDFLDEKTAREKAKELIEEPNQHPFIICRCFDYLDDETAREKAKELIEKSHHHQVICRCLKALRNDPVGFDHAVRFLRNWKDTFMYILFWAFTIAGRSDIGRNTANEIMKEWDNIKHPQVKASGLMYSDPDIARPVADEVLQRWPSSSRALVTAALVAFDGNPEYVRTICEQIFNRWHKEIQYQRTRKYNRYDGHLVKALKNPHCRKVSHEVSQDMLYHEETNPGFLTPRLKETVQQIVDGNCPDWAFSEMELEKETPFETP